MKKIPYWAVVVAILIVATPAAFANHCERCRAAPPPYDCITVPLNGQTECDTDGETYCWTSGIYCSHGPGSLSLASEYAVASVERLDEPAQSADETRMTRLAETQPSR